MKKEKKTFTPIIHLMAWRGKWNEETIRSNQQNDKIKKFNAISDWLAIDFSKLGHSI